MGYDTFFVGSFDLDKKLDDETLEMVGKLNEYSESFDNEDSDSFINSNPQFEKPRVDFTHSYCQWIPTEDAMSITYDGQEKFYDYIVWLEYLIQVLDSRGYKLNGDVRFGGEDCWNDHGYIKVRDNVVYTDNQGLFTSSDNRSGWSALVYYSADTERLDKIFQKEGILAFNSYNKCNADGVIGM